jgi:hypothetical protein
VTIFDGAIRADRIGKAWVGTRYDTLASVVVEKTWELLYGPLPESIPGDSPTAWNRDGYLHASKN